MSYQDELDYFYLCCDKWIRDNAKHICEPEPSSHNSVGEGNNVNQQEESAMGTEVGTVFSTGNATVAQLPEGTVLQVVGPGKLRVGVAPTAAFSGEAAADEPYEPQQGDEITIPSKNDRFGVVARAGVSIASVLDEGEILYISEEGDGLPVVRKIAKSAVEPTW